MCAEIVVDHYDNMQKPYQIQCLHVHFHGLYIPGTYTNNKVILTSIVVNVHLKTCK